MDDCTDEDMAALASALHPRPKMPVGATSAVESATLPVEGPTVAHEGKSAGRRAEDGMRRGIGAVRFPVCAGPADARPAHPPGRESDPRPGGDHATGASSGTMRLSLSYCRPQSIAAMPRSAACGLARWFRTGR